MFQDLRERPCGLHNIMLMRYFVAQLFDVKCVLEYPSSSWDFGMYPVVDGGAE